MKIDSIIFDLDGTLWDATKTFKKLFDGEMNKVQGVKGKVTREQIESAMGLQIGDFVKKIFPYLNEDSQMKVGELFTTNNFKYVNKYGGEVYTNVEETLKTLSKKYSLFIVSNCELGYIDAFFNNTKLDKYFTGYESSGNTKLSKKDNIELVAKRYNLKNPIYVGDTNLDYESAKGANVPFVFASYGFGDVENSKYKIDDIVDLIGVVDEINNDLK